MIEIRKAVKEDVSGICRVCSESYRDTYPGLLSRESIENVIREFYDPKRILEEVTNPVNWNGWWVAVHEGVVAGAGGGGITGPGVGELLVLYVDPKRRWQGIGTRLLEAITDELRSQGIREQWVSVLKNNMKGIPFYEARGFEVMTEQPTYSIQLTEKCYSLRMRRFI
jgi:ribosomal protein S18 acetylase RimI-like enzyme